MTGSLVVVLNQHQELCALHKPGGVPVECAQLVECVNAAAAAAPQLLLLLEKVLHAHAIKLADAAELLRRTGRAPSTRASAREAGPLLQPASSIAPTSGSLGTSCAAEPASAVAGTKRKTKRNRD